MYEILMVLISGIFHSGTFGGSNILELGSNILRPQNFIAPKASAEGACILAEMGYCYRMWMVTFTKCGYKSGASWRGFLTVTLMMV